MHPRHLAFILALSVTAATGRPCLAEGKSGAAARKPARPQSEKEQAIRRLLVLTGSGLKATQRIAELVGIVSG